MLLIAMWRLQSTSNEQYKELAPTLYTMQRVTLTNQPTGEEAFCLLPAAYTPPHHTGATGTHRIAQIASSTLRNAGLL